MLKNFSCSGEGSLKLVLNLSETLEGWVSESASRQFEATLIDLEQQKCLWQGGYCSLPAAKRAVIAAAKRFNCVSPRAKPDQPVTDPADELRQTETTWEWEPEVFSYCAWFEGSGVGIDGVVTEGKGGTFEGDLLLGPYVLREEYPDAWSARRGVIMRAEKLISQIVIV